jgi:hypothetical protein
LFITALGAVASAVVTLDGVHQFFSCWFHVVTCMWWVLVLQQNFCFLPLPQGQGEYLVLSLAL